MVRRQRGHAKRKAFEHFYALSDPQGYFELDATRAAAEIGCARKTVYEAVAFLQRVNLLRRITYRTGRGQHSTYWLNWRKPEPGSVKKCHPPKNPRSVNTNTAINDRRSAHGDHSPRRGERQRPPSQAEIEAKLERVEELVRQERVEPARRLMLMTLRWSGWAAGLSRGEQRAVVEAAGAIVWRERLSCAWEAVRELIRALRRGIWFEELRSWLRRVRAENGKYEAVRACYAYLGKRLRAKVAAERAWEAEWARPEPPAAAGAADLSVWATAFAALHGRAPSESERAAAGAQLAAALGEGGACRS